MGLNGALMTKNVSVNHRMRVRIFKFPPEISIITFRMMIFLVEDGQCILPIPEERYDVETVLVIGGQEMIIIGFKLDQLDPQLFK